jgi:hypothetical protein
MNHETDWKEILAATRDDEEAGSSTGTPENGGWLRVDEREDLVNSLEHAVDIARTVRSEPPNWKWLLIVTHNALQGALVSVLTGTDGLRALEKKCMVEWLKWHEKRRAGEDEPHPKEFLAPPLELYCRAKQKDFMFEFGGNPITTTEEQDGDVRKLNWLRGELIHFKSRTWAIEIEGLPRIVLNAVEVIEQLLNHPALSFRLKREAAARAEKAIDELRRTFSTTHQMLPSK